MKIILLIMVFTNPSPTPKQYAIASVYDTMAACLEHQKDYRSFYSPDTIECIELNKKEQ